MKSVRLGPELEEKVQKAAAVNGESVSEFLRRAAAERADRALLADNLSLFDDVAGVVHGGGGRARRSGEAFGRLLAQRSPKK